MKIAASLIIVSLLFYLSFPLYVKWHLSTFEGGMVYTLLNLASAPDNYHYPVVDKTILTGQDEDIYLEHKYAGDHLVMIMGEQELSFSGALICNGKFIKLSTETKPFYLEKYKEHWMLVYSVPSELPFEANCKLTSRSDTLRKVEFSIVKFTHQ